MELSRGKGERGKMYTGRGGLKGDAGCLGINGKKYIRLLDKCEEGDEGARVT